MSEPNRIRVPGVHWFLLASCIAVFIWSGIKPAGYLNWVAETFAVIIGVPLLVFIYPRFRFSTLSYSVVWFFSIILMVGGHYTYAEVPIGDWFQEQFDLSRNHYDRFGHFFQGVVPALLARELVVRTTPLKSGKWLFFCCMCVAVAISAFYELFEWQYAMLTNPDAAGTYLGQQGDEWDAQKDILMAFLGSTSFLLLFSGLQDRQIRAIEAETPSRTPAQT